MPFVEIIATFINYYFLVIFRAHDYKNYNDIFLPISKPFLISLTLAPFAIFFCAIFIICPIRTVDVVVPSPANLLVPLTLFLTSVDIAS